MPVEIKQTVRVGTRRSQLALAQTKLAINMLELHYPNLHFVVVEISTVGDKILDVALSKIGDKSLFTKELEVALLSEEVDFVVHSLKDVPTSIPPGLVLGCVFDRASPDDVVLMSPENRGKKLSDLPSGSIVGTSALRRVASLQRLYPRLKFVSIRGNLNTRLKKLDEPHTHFATEDNHQKQFDHLPTKYDAIILAKAGIERLGWSERIDQVLSDQFYAVSQGALACECREEDTFILSILSKLHCEPAALSSIAERALMSGLDGGCSTPIGVRSHIGSQSDEHPWLLSVVGCVMSLDGSQCVNCSLGSELPHRIPKEHELRHRAASGNSREDSVDREISTDLAKNSFAGSSSEPKSLVNRQINEEKSKEHKRHSCTGSDEHQASLLLQAEDKLKFLDSAVSAVSLCMVFVQVQDE
ncbi:Porphobilinogen deaminase [Fasciolopsis buskii]|uniref:hydroxymethylbilane synthase n=1 Tax=Fasciolopsis buskii TaxID=27845 RepID=A0A8E0VFH7_9TREM|nr:Porphobilinogen deaminase [Fasciolopsis buski]